MLGSNRSKNCQSECILNLEELMQRKSRQLDKLAISPSEKTLNFQSNLPGSLHRISSMRCRTHLYGFNRTFTGM